MLEVSHRTLSVLHSYHAVPARPPVHIHTYIRTVKCLLDPPVHEVVVVVTPLSFLPSWSNRGWDMRESLLRRRESTSGKWRGSRWSTNRRRWGGSDRRSYISVFVDVHMYCVGECVWVCGSGRVGVWEWVCGCVLGWKWLGHYVYQIWRRQSLLKSQTEWRYQDPKLQALDPSYVDSVVCTYVHTYVRMYIRTYVWTDSFRYDAL